MKCIMEELIGVFTVFVGYLVILALCVTISACKPLTRSQVVEKTNAIYTGLKIVVTDPVVSTALGQDRMAVLATAERAYLTSVKALSESDTDTDVGKAAIKAIVECGTAILSELDGVSAVDKYQAEIAAARIAIKLLQNRLM